MAPAALPAIAPTAAASANSSAETHVRSVTEARGSTWLPCVATRRAIDVVAQGWGELTGGSRRMQFVQELSGMHSVARRRRTAEAQERLVMDYQ